VAIRFLEKIFTSVYNTSLCRK